MCSWGSFAGRQGRPLEVLLDGQPVHGLSASRIARLGLAHSPEGRDYAYVMERGRIVTQGTPDELRRDERVLAAYLG